ncbi:hypothetical protein MMC20_002490 [Loxospora ochrophaea]|nr:hypothetical protein [Loxospora ochrophaea]
MSPSERPTIVILPGAFHPASTFRAIIPYLQDVGFPTVVETLSSVNPSDPTSTTCASDALSFRDKALVPLIEMENKNVVLLLHSYGGVVGGAAAVGLDKSTRLSQNKSGGIIGVCHLSANIVPEGETVLSTIGGQLPPFIKPESVSTSSNLEACIGKARKYPGSLVRL